VVILNPLHTQTKIFQFLWGENAEHSPAGWDSDEFVSCYVILFKSLLDPIYGHHY